MGKAKSFADKVAKGLLDKSAHCAECGEALTMIKLVETEKSEKSGAWKFNQSFVGMCKCNEAELTQ